MTTAIATGIEKTKIMELLRGAGTCEDFIDQGDGESLGFSVVVGEHSVLVNAKFLIEMIRKMKLKTLRVQTTYSEANDNRTGSPLVITSDDTPSWKQCVMPMSRE